MQIQIIDLFSGPGGLGEGFSSFKNSDGTSAYNIALSIEKDRAAHATLQLRAFLRSFEQFPTEYYSWIAGENEAPDWPTLYPKQWKIAEREAVCAELGRTETSQLLSDRISAVRKSAADRTLLIGGPPCQAYSVVGRARNAGILGYDPENDERHYLYREYCRVLNELNPAAFVMENVKGMLSSSVKGKMIFDQVAADLRNAGSGYQLTALSEDPSTTNHAKSNEFVIRSEDYGIPQRRHRVIIIGIRSDLQFSKKLRILPSKSESHVGEVLSGLPELRSGLSRQDEPNAWQSAMHEAISAARQSESEYSGENYAAYSQKISSVERELGMRSNAGRKSNRNYGLSEGVPTDLARFIEDKNLVGISGHETRGHMPSDLARYLFASCFAAAEGKSPRANQFPDALAPKHKSWKTGKFNDRFRVQLSNSPATTITSHIAKDGHYFIHPDPTQCRSLTVREAARIQTFPDNYHFMGNRTQQFVQVGNAVPPFLARQIAEAILPIFETI